MDRKESTVRPWQVCKEVFVSFIHHLQQFGIRCLTLLVFCVIVFKDVGILVKGLPAKDVATNFTDRWEFIRRKYKLFLDSFNNSMPSLPHNISVPVGGTYEANDDVVNSLTTGGYPSDRSSQNCSCQIVRTLGDWSGGLKKPEISHYQAWIKAINSAKEYIYIEQQFFIVNIGEGHAKNRVGEALLNRAIAAIDESREFKIYVVIPEILDSTVCFYTRKSLVQDSSNNSKRVSWSCLIILFVLVYSFLLFLSQHYFPLLLSRFSCAWLAVSPSP